MSRKKVDEVKIIVDRLKQTLKVKTDKDLAERLGIDHSTLSGWRTRNYG